MSEFPPIKHQPGQGLCLDLTPYRKLTFPWPGGDFMEPRHQQLLLRLAGDFLPRASTMRPGRVYYQLTVAGRDVTEGAACLADSNESIPAAEVARLRAAMTRLREEAEDASLSEKDRAVLDFFRLPSPAHDPELYWLYGPPEDRRILILWGLEKMEFASLPPESAVDCLPVARSAEPAVEPAPKFRGRKESAWPALAVVAVLLAGGFGAWHLLDRGKHALQPAERESRPAASPPPAAKPSAVAKSGNEIAHVPLPSDVKGSSIPAQQAKERRSTPQELSKPVAVAPDVTPPPATPTPASAKPNVTAAQPAPPPFPKPVEVRPALPATSGSPDATKPSPANDPAPKKTEPALTASSPDQPSPNVKASSPAPNVAATATAPPPASPSQASVKAPASDNASSPKAPPPAAAPKVAAQAPKPPPPPAVPAQMVMSGLSMPSVTSLPPDSNSSSRAVAIHLPPRPYAAKAAPLMEMRPSPTERSRPLRVAHAQFPPAAGCIYHASNFGPVPINAGYPADASGRF